MTELISKKLVVTSSTFANNKPIPSIYTCEGDNINPPLKIEGIPTQAKSLALIMDDPDAPHGTFVHWVVWNIPPTGEIDEHSAPGNEGVNGRGQNIYSGPCPPSGTHRYFFKIYALDAELDLPSDTTSRNLETEMKGHIVAAGQLIGLYSSKYQR